jgi:hypothetical protein
VKYLGLLFDECPLRARSGRSIVIIARTNRFRSNICRSTNCHALVVRVDTGRRPNDVDLAALTHSPTTFVHNLGSRLRRVKRAKVGIHLG